MSAVETDMEDSTGTMALGGKRSLLVFFILISFIPIFDMIAEASPCVEIILDASFTMNEPFEGGKKKLDAAKEAILGFLDHLDGDVPVALRVYGHMALRQLRDCTDSELVTPFAPVSRNKARIARMLRSVYGRGVTPLAGVFREAIKDLSSQPYRYKHIVLLADGPSTCTGDPCGILEAVNRTRGRRGHIFVSTIGIRPDFMAPSQLGCIASITGGRYFQAQTMDELNDAFQVLSGFPRRAVLRLRGKGKLLVDGVDPGNIEITSSGNETPVEGLINVDGTLDLPAGIYSVTIGGQVWESVMIREGETTTLPVGKLSIMNAGGEAHLIREWESWQIVGTVSSDHPEQTVMPGKYEVLFGEARWPVNVTAGNQTILKPGIVMVENISPKGAELRELPQNIIVGHLTRRKNWMPLPPGDYLISIEGNSVQFSLAEGQRKVY